MARDTITRVFYAFDDSKTPFVIAICSVAVKVLMNAIFVKTYGISGIMISTTAVTIFNAVVLGFLILKKKINLDYKGFLVPLTKMGLASLLTGSLCLCLNNFIVGFNDQPSWLFLFVKLGVLFLIGGIVYFIISILLKLSIAKVVLKKLLSRAK